MAKSIMHTVWYVKGGKHYKVFKVGFGGDGSYYVTAPYHPHDKAIAGKILVDYSLRRPIELKEGLNRALKLTVLDDDERRLKLSHHRDGFLQFSGEGIRSGRNASGSARGLGVMSWTLDEPTFGPSFGVNMFRPEHMGQEGHPFPGDVVVNADELEHMRLPGHEFMDVRFEGHYLPPRFRSFVSLAPGGGYRISIVNPQSHVVKNLQVVMASKECSYPGIIGVAAEPHELGLEGFILTSSTGSLRRNLKGDLIGEQLVCVYPQLHDFSTFRVESLNYGTRAHTAVFGIAGIRHSRPPSHVSATGRNYKQDKKAET